MYQSLQLIWEACFISWDSMRIIYSWFWHNIYFFLIEKLSFWSSYVIDYYMCYPFSKHVLTDFTNSDEVLQVL